MELLKIENNWILILVLMAAVVGLVYFVLPKMVKDYTLAKGIKLSLLYTMMGYLCYDFYKQEKYLFVLFFVGGAILFTYVILQAKEK